MMPSSPRRPMIRLRFQDTPTRRATELASSCREANLNTGDTKRISDYMTSFCAGDPLYWWRVTLYGLIADTVGEPGIRAEDLDSMIEAGGFNAYKSQIWKHFRAGGFFETSRKVWDMEVSKLYDGWPIRDERG